MSAPPCYVIAGLAAVFAVSAPASALSQANSGRPVPVSESEWISYGRDPLGSRHSPLRQIDTANVGRLMVAWTYRTGEAEIRTGNNRALEATPIMVEGTLYLITPLARVIALDPATGQERWVYDAGLDRTIRFGDHTSRGVSWWVDRSAAPGAPCRARIIAPTIDARLIALDAATGRPCEQFGTAGVVNLRTGLRNTPTNFAEYELTSPPAIVNDVIVVGSAIADNGNTEAASGEVRGFDARTGALRWTWHPVPQNPGDPGYDTWRGPRARQSGGANTWSVIAADPARDLVFLPTSSPSVDYFGGTRLGRNDHANAVVALRASTGALVWSFQTVHHDLWDYDNASPPLLAAVEFGGRRRDAVLQGTKTGQLFVLDRETGVPIIPVREVPVPASTIPGEEAWPTQPQSAIGPLSRTALPADSIFGATEADRAACRERIAGLRWEGSFTPPSLEGSLTIPSNIGGAHWGGVAFDPAAQIAVVPVNTIAAMVRLIPMAVFDTIRRDTRGRIGAEYTRMRGTPYGMYRELLFSPGGVPCTPPPFGELVGVNLRTGSIAWRSPLGGPMGGPNLGGAITTAGGLTFIAATGDRMFRAFATASGRELWRAELPAGGKATPMTYRDRNGRQIVIISAGGDGGYFGMSDAIVAFALP